MGRIKNGRESAAKVIRVRAETRDAACGSQRKQTGLRCFITINGDENGPHAQSMRPSWDSQQFWRQGVTQKRRRRMPDGPNAVSL
jgi:hypothetical protein